MPNYSFFQNAADLISGQICGNTFTNLFLDSLNFSKNAHYSSIFKLLIVYSLLFSMMMVRFFNFSFHLVEVFNLDGAEVDTIIFDNFLCFLEHLHWVSSALNLS